MPCTVADVPPGWNWIRRRADALPGGTAVGGDVGAVTVTTGAVGSGGTGVGNGTGADGDGRVVTVVKGVGDGPRDWAHPVANTKSNIHVPS